MSKEKLDFNVGSLVKEGHRIAVFVEDYFSLWYIVNLTIKQIDADFFRNCAEVVCQHVDQTPVQIYFSNGARLIGYMAKHPQTRFAPFTVGIVDMGIPESILMGAILPALRPLQPSGEIYPIKFTHVNYHKAWRMLLDNIISNIK